MLHIFNARNAKTTARVLERFMERLGFDLKHGQALDALAVMAGAGNWSALANGELSEAAVNRHLLDVELRHVEENRDNSYGQECALVAHTGFELRYSASADENLTYVRVCDPLGREVGYWVDDEWKEDPQIVMGAILGALTRGNAIIIENGRHLRTTAHVEAHETKMPTVQDLPFDQISTVIIDAVPHFLRYCDPDGVDALLGHSPDAERGGEDDQSWRTVLELGTEDDGFIKEYDLDVGQLRSMRWDPEQKLFIDPDGSNFKFFVATPFGA